eukprot:TRINITY_DN1062_c0_g1_i1.p1 TRINITY_DN1062_c0_g1~~TRINITY_DN1062_c0_g1_i1.p1  ORF type:complete len:185 (+),score=7.16 TRINITY_DN1062_c0_g1_i1:132-686(+)
MASATTRPTFFFNFHKSTTKPKTHFAIPLQFPKKPLIPTLLHNPIQCTSKSIDVSEEENGPVPDQPERGSKLDPRRLEEKFVALNTGIYECRSCGYKYDESAGEPSYPIPPGFEFGKLPEDWRCPTCGAAKSFFESKRVEIAGFAQNQQFGLGGNALTSGQKAVLIYGSLFVLFVLFLSGYFLQ